MKLFMLKSLLITSIMFICVLFGMQQANNGIHKMKGYNDPDLGNAFTLTDGKKGQIQGTFLGKNVTSHDLEKKKQELEKMNTYNFFSSTGKKMADGISSAADKTIELITKGIEK